MDNLIKRQISAIVRNEKDLETIINELMEETVSRHDISIQGSPHDVAAEYGTSYLNPLILQKSNHSPKKEPFLHDDFGWVLGFAFSTPFFIGIIIGIFIIGDLRNTYDVLFYGGWGALIGALIGLILSLIIKAHHNHIISKQEQKGGFALWITVTTDDQLNKVKQILKKYHASHIAIAQLATDNQEL